MPNPAPKRSGKNAPELSKSSRFNLRLMKRTNLLAILMFSAGVIYKLVEYLFL